MGTGEGTGEAGNGPGVRLIRSLKRCTRARVATRVTNVPCWTTRLFWFTNWRSHETRPARRPWATASMIVVTTWTTSPKKTGASNFHSAMLTKASVETLGSRLDNPANTLSPNNP